MALRLTVTYRICSAHTIVDDTYHPTSTSASRSPNKGCKTARVAAQSDRSPARREDNNHRGREARREYNLSYPSGRRQSPEDTLTVHKTIRTVGTATPPR